MPVLCIQELRVPTLDLFIVLQKALVVDKVLEGFSNFIKVDVVIILDLLVNIVLPPHYVLSEQLETLYLVLGVRAGSSRTCRFE